VVKDCGYMEIRCINCIYIHIQPKYDVFNLDFKDNVFLLMQNITFDCGVDTQRWDVSTSYTSPHIHLYIKKKIIHSFTFLCYMFIFW